MKKKNIFFIWLITTAFLWIANSPPVWAQSNFKFPKLIDFKVLKDNKVIGSCRLFCTEKTGMKGYSKELASLKLINFQGLGFGKKDKLYTSVYRDDLSLFIASVARSKKVVSQVRIQEGKHANGKKGRIYIYRDMKTKAENQQELKDNYPVIDFLSTFLLASERVAAREHKTSETFYFVLKNNKKIVDMVYQGTENVEFQGKPVTVETLMLIESGNNPTEIFRLKIFKDNQGHCFPVSVLFKDKKKAIVEIRADKVQKSQTYWGLQPLFVASLTFMDAISQSINDRTGVAKLINENVVERLNKALTSAGKRWGRRVLINEKGHTISISGESVKQLTFITFNPDLSPTDKLKVITDQIMEPADVDALVTGQYIVEPTTDKVIIRPIVILKDSKKIITEKWEFKPAELVCPQKTTGDTKQVLCPQVLDRIDNLFSTPPPVFAAFLGFTDATMQHLGGNTRETRLILEAFSSVMSRELGEIVEKRKKRLLIDEIGHSVPHTLKNVENIIKLTFDTNLTLEDKRKKIINDTMNPHHVDGIVTGQYIFNPQNPVFAIRPIMIFKAAKGILTAIFQFRRDELTCPNPSGTGKILCKEALQKITEKVKPFLLELYK